MNQVKILLKTSTFVRSTLEGEGSGHDWWHIQRVVNNAKLIAKGEKADLFIVELAALLHDIADWKFNKGNLEKSSRVSIKWLKSIGADPEAINRVSEIINEISFKGSKEKNKMKGLEGKIVQDADRLDALGAIGIARAFAYGGNKNRALYDPEVKITVFKNFAQYKKGSESTIHHFYEKLLLAKDLMNTKTGKKLAIHRHKYLENFLKEFYAEWNGKK